jgi:poly(hydroxyalkanoate) depolymerase family esterase
VLALHYCTGTAQAYYQSTKYAQLAETHGYFVIYGNAPRSGGCWDVASSQTLSHNAGGDSLGLASAVRYAIANWGVDASRVFVTGSSSGAMMTSVLAGAYPDVFRAGAVDSGVAFGCFAGASAWNSQCAQGKLIQTAQQWVRASPSTHCVAATINTVYVYRAMRSAMRTRATLAHAPKCKFGTARSTRPSTRRTSGRRSSNGPTCTHLLYSVW